MRLDGLEFLRKITTIFSTKKLIKFQQWTTFFKSISSQHHALFFSLFLFRTIMPIFSIDLLRTFIFHLVSFFFFIRRTQVSKKRAKIVAKQQSKAYWKVYTLKKQIIIFLNNIHYAGNL